MKNYITPDTLRRAGLALLALLLLASCASTSLKSEIEHGKALINAGRVRDGYTRILEIRNRNPESAEAKLAFDVAQERYAALLTSQAEAAVAEKRWEDAERAYAQLAEVPGRTVSATEGRRKLAAARNEAGGTSASAKAPTQVSMQPVAPPPVAADVRPLISASAPAAASSTPRTVAAPAADASAETNPQAKLISMQFKDASVRSLFDVISKSSGLNIIIDKDVSPDLKTSVFLKNTTIEAAIDKILLTTQLAMRKLDDNTLLIYPDDPGKQHEHKERVLKAFHLANADAKVVANTLKSMLKVRDIVVDEKLNMILMRDSERAIRLAEKIVALQDVPEPEVMLEVEILEVNTSYLQSLGIDWPAGVSLYPIPRTGDFNPEAPLPFNNIRGGILSGPATLRARGENGDVNVLANPRIRAKNKEKARILIGERLPNINSTITSSGLVAENITYIEVGLKLDIEPQVFADDLVVIKIGFELSTAQPATTSKTAYQINTRNANTVLRLKDGENQILAGLIQDEDRKANGRIPGLGDIPILGKLFGSDTNSKSKKEIVLSITPRLVRGIARPAVGATEFSSGTDASIRGRNMEGFNSAPAQSFDTQRSQSLREGEDASERPRRRSSDDEED